VALGSETILDHVSLALHEGEILTVIGRTRRQDLAAGAS